VTASQGCRETRRSVIASLYRAAVLTLKQQAVALHVLQLRLELWRIVGVGRVMDWQAPAVERCAGRVAFMLRDGPARDDTARVRDFRVFAPPGRVIGPPQRRAGAGMQLDPFLQYNLAAQLSDLAPPIIGHEPIKDAVGFAPRDVVLFIPRESKHREQESLEAGAARVKRKAANKALLKSATK
jgi:hypothetical protein